MRPMVGRNTAQQMKTETVSPGSAGIPAGDVSANRRTFLKTLLCAGTGLAVAGVTSADDGRFNVTHVESDRHVFRVPSLRNVELTE